ncbi:MAG: hypothetical protein M1831_002603 [Alyxoria varia]|nr:MAG: hypothetical protein M1831_002603 [Alyxoria varia]
MMTHPMKSLAHRVTVKRKKRNAKKRHRWDSSDPERAPPPLPLNPGRVTPNASPTKANTSSTVAAAAQALVDRARENMASPYVTNNSPQKKSPEKSPTRTPGHQRFQSLQNSYSWESKQKNDAQSEKVNSRANTPVSGRDYFSSSPERSLVKSGTPTPMASEKESNDGPPVRPSARPLPKPMRAESTPPTVSQLAIQTMKEEQPLADVTNGSIPKDPQNFESIHAQMLNLTNIANLLQKEMAALSRRSKDNATDLVSLKEATKSRDEDIRKNLSELVKTSRPSNAGLLNPPRPDHSRPNSVIGLTQGLLDNKAFGSPNSPKSISLPKIPPPHTFDIGSEHERSGSPSPFSVEGTASVAMLEKIIREMVTKEGQERLISTLTEIMDKSSKESSEASKKVAELLDFIKEKSSSNALVKHGARRSSNFSDDTQFEDVGRETLARNNHRSGNQNTTSQAQPNLVNEEFIKLLQKVRDSVAHSGGMTGEVKSLLRELRGEVLGMGRDLGRKLEHLEKSGSHGGISQDAVSREELEEVVQDGLADLKESMDRVIESRRRQSSASAISRYTVDSEEVQQVVKHALAERGFVDQSQALQKHTESVDRESILATVKDACEAYKPEIEVQQFGLERDEILQCLKEGLEDYQTSRAEGESGGISREEVIEAIQDGMQNFNPPAPTSEFGEMKDEILASVRECLEEFNPVSQERSVNHTEDFSRDDILEAVRQGLGDFKKEGAREIEISPDDLFQAMRAGLESMPTPFGQYGEQVLNSLHEIVEGMRVEFKQYSAANGRDTEQVLDAMKDGMEDLRAAIETYVDRAQDVTGKEEIIGTLTTELRSLRDGFEGAVAQSADKNDAGSAKSSELIEYIKAEFEHLHEAVNPQSTSNDSSLQHKEEILVAVTNGIEELKSISASKGLDNSNEEQLEALKEEFEQLRDAVLNGTAAQKDEILESVQESFGGLHAAIASSSPGSGDNSDLINSLKEEFVTLKESMAAPVLHSGGNSGSTDEIIEAVRDAVNGIGVQLTADQNEASRESLGTIKEELENLREAIGGSLMLSTPDSDKDNILQAIRSELEELSAKTARDEGSGSTEALESVREELENLRQSMSSGLVQSGDQAGTEEILETLRGGLDDLKAQLGSQVTVSEPRNPVNDDGFEALRDNLDNLRSDISKLADKPVDMTVSYEILDTLKDGLSNVRSDIDRLKSGVSDVVLAENTKDDTKKDEDNSSANLQRSDLERFEVMMAQLQIKIEALDQNMQSSPFMNPDMSSERSAPNNVSKQDLSGIESTLRELHEAVSGMSGRESSGTISGGAMKEDTDALETLVQNTKAKIDDELIPAIESTATREQVESIDTIVRLTSETLDNLGAKMDSMPSDKQDIEAMALMIHEANTSLKEMKERLKSSEDGENVTKGDIESIESICTTMKEKIDDLPSGDNLPSREDIETLGELIEEFREGQAELKERYESDINVTAKAFDDRKEESKAILDQIEEVKGLVEESKEQLKSRLKRSNEDVRALDEILQGIEDKIDDAPDAISEVKELQETLNREFERAQASLDSLKSEQETTTTSILERHDKHKASIISELGAHFEERFNSIMARHDEHQKTAESNAQILNDKSAQQDDLLSGTRAMAEELKVTIDTLGESVTAISPAMAEATEKMGDDAKTVYNRVDEMTSKLDSDHAEDMGEHQVTREDIAKTLLAISNLHEESASHHPEVMDALKNLYTMVEQQTKESREDCAKTHDGLKAHFDEGLKSLPVPRLEAPAPSAPVEKAGDSKIYSKLDEILDRPQSQAYDDSSLQIKLDELLNQTQDSAKSMPQLEKLDEIHQQVQTTASEVSAFVAFQTKMLTAEQENKEKEADQAALDLSKCLNEKESVESDISGLRETKDGLKSEVEGLKSEKDNLMSQKMHLSADVSSLETALRLRREELQMMDARADALERRIIEGVMDHSRALLIAKAPRQPANMNLKRVSSNNSNSTTATTTPSMVNNGVGMALKSQPAGRKREKSANPSSRRIMSLSQITNNVPAGGKALSSSPRDAGALGNMKRSQSVRTPQTVRKGSWNPPGSGSLAGYDKENEMVSEESESEAEEGTNTRSVSYGNTVSDGNAPSMESRSSQAPGPTPSEYTYGTGSSYFTGSETDRRSSYGSTIRSNVAAISKLDDSIHEDEEGSEDDGEHERSQDGSDSGSRHSEGPPQIEAPPMPETDMQIENVPYSEAGEKHEDHHPDHHTDSGLGSDMPTADLSPANIGSDYFQRLEGLEEEA